MLLAIKGEKSFPFLLQSDQSIKDTQENHREEMFTNKIDFFSSKGWSKNIKQEKNLDHRVLNGP